MGIAGAWGNSSDAQMAADSVTEPIDGFLHDDEATALADSVLEDAEDAFDVDTSVAQAAVNADSSQQYVNAAEEVVEHGSETQEMEDDSWFSKAIEAFRRGFMGY